MELIRVCNGERRACVQIANMTAKHTLMTKKTHLIMVVIETNKSNDNTRDDEIDATKIVQRVTLLR